jgi:IS30 family transposase
MGRQSIDEELVQRIVAASADGFSYRQIRVWAGVNASTISRYVHAHQMSRMRLPVYVGPVVRAGSLRLGDRVKIAVGIERGESNAVIGERLGFGRSSIWREISNSGGRGGYDPEVAQARATRLKRRGRPCWFELKPELWIEVQRLIKTRKWSPQQISARLRRDHDNDPDWSVSHESIYDAIFVQAKPELRKELAACLRSGRARRVPHGRRSKHDQPSITGMINISERPAEVEDRAVPGHWEGDLILGKGGRSYIATLVERTTRFAMMIKLDNKTAAHVAERIAEHLKTLPDLLAKTVTWDQGTELADHRDLALAADIAVYFCDPHSPWQRGSNENWNGLARQFLPKGTDLSVHTQSALDDIAELINTRPRQTLGWDTPAEQFTQLVAPTT